ncbi:MAG: hypothetical protein KGR26_14995, partial [Cyanobacteria bacterium REEB65]|nr:hypothetical protein [Cyanobacteria bacterium REEB65]
TVSVVITYSGLEDSSARERYQDLSPVRVRERFESLATGEVQGGKLLAYHITDPEDLDSPMQVSYSYRAPELADRAGDLLIFHIPGFHPGMSNFAKVDRQFPMWWERLSRGVEQTDIHVPAGYGVRFLPKDAHDVLPEVSFSGSYRQNGHTIRFVTDFSGLTRREIAPADYPAVRALLQRQALFGKELIVLEARPASGT